MTAVFCKTVGLVCFCAFGARSPCFAVNGLFISLFYGASLRFMCGGKRVLCIFFYRRRICNTMKLTWNTSGWYKVKQGQTVRSLAYECGVTAFAIVEKNGLVEELYEGQLIRLPELENLYTVQVGDTKQSLCGGEEGYRKLNGTDVFYPAMRVRIGGK